MNTHQEFVNFVPVTHCILNERIYPGDELLIYEQRVKVFSITKHTKSLPTVEFMHNDTIYNFGDIEEDFVYYTVSADPHSRANYHVTKTTDANIRKVYKI